MENKLVSFLSGAQVLAEVESSVSGKLTVVRDIAWGTYIVAGGITQSGGVAKTVWKASLKRVWREKKEVRRALILGLGGGSIASLIEKYWRRVDIVGVDIDPVMVELGQKYLGMDPELKVVIADAVEWVKKDKKKYDLICLDTYVGDDFPKRLTCEKFLGNVKKLLDKDGVVVVNRLYSGEKRKEAELFEKKLERVFGEVERVYPEANVMFIARAT